MNRNPLRPNDKLPTLKPIAIACALACSTGGMLLLPQITYAQESHERQQVSIPAGKLSSVLATFAAQVGAPLSFDPSMFSGRQSSGLKGRYSAVEGFNVLLQGTRFHIEKQSNGNYVIRKTLNDGIMPAIQVNAGSEFGSANDAYRMNDSNVGVLGDLSLQNTPYSVEVYSRDLIDNLQANSLSGVTKLDASVSLSADDMVSENNYFMIRGLSPDGTTGQKIDGLNLQSRAKDLPMEHIDKIEVLKGASGFLYGFGAPGGIVNYSLKRPTDSLTRNVKGQIMNDNLMLFHGDVGDRFGKNDQFGYRLNIVNQTGDSYVDDAKSQRQSGSIAVDWKVSPTLFWRADALYANRKSYGGYWAIIPNTDGKLNNWEVGEPLSPINGSKRLMPDWMIYESEHKTFGSELTWKFKENWDAKISARYSESYRNLPNPAIFASKDGNYSVKSWNYNNIFESFQSQVVVNGDVDTDIISHNISFGMSNTNSTASNSSNLGTDINLENIGNLSDPLYFSKDINILSKSDARYDKYSEINRNELFISDVLNVGHNLDFILGARYGEIDNKYAQYKEDSITPTIATVYRPKDWLSLYASYVEAFEEGAIAPDTSVNAGEVFSPKISKQYETGFKIEQPSWSTNFAIFKLERALSYTDSNNVYSQDGEAVFKELKLLQKQK